MTPDALRAALAEALRWFDTEGWKDSPDTLLWLENGDKSYPLMADAILAHPAVLAALDRSDPVRLREAAHKAAEIGYTYGALGRDFTYVYRNVEDMLAATPTASPTELHRPIPEQDDRHEG